MIEGKRVDYDGKHYSAHVECLPKPAGKIRLVLGGTYADELIIFSTPMDQFLKLRSIIKAKNERTEISHMGSFVIGSRSELDRRIKRHLKLRGLVGDPEKAKQELQRNGVF
ncbi:MAG: hypothetical protein ACYC7D_06630 [Nitrososphaerales archaeon]